MITTSEAAALWTPERIDGVAQDGARLAAQLIDANEAEVRDLLAEDYYAIANEAGILLSTYVPGVGTTREQRGPDAATSRELVERVTGYLNALDDEQADVTLQDKMYGANRSDDWWDSRRPDGTATKIGARGVYGIAISRRLEGTNTAWEAQTHVLAQRIKDSEGTPLHTEGMSVSDWLINHARLASHQKTMARRHNDSSSILATLSVLSKTTDLPLVLTSSGDG